MATITRGRKSTRRIAPAAFLLRGVFGLAHAAASRNPDEQRGNGAWLPSVRRPSEPGELKAKPEIDRRD
ncbi:MAG TPA: hypothetical protein VIK60_15635 [Vicinamibacterales bacterium]